MRRYWLNDGVYCSEVGEALIFLDLRSGRYHALTRDDCSPLRPSVRQCPGGARSIEGFEQENDDQDIVQPLLEQGLLAPEPGSRPTTLAPAATGLLPYVKFSRVNPLREVLIVLRFLVAYSSCAWFFRFGSMKSQIDRLRKRKAACAVEALPGLSELSALMGYFHFLRALSYTSRDRCVFDSLVLSDFLLRNGIRPTLIIGVQTRPFRGHCWVQSDSVLLADSIERTSRHTPILAV